MPPNNPVRSTPLVICICSVTCDIAEIRESNKLRKYVSFGRRIILQTTNDQDIFFANFSLQTIRNVATRHGDRIMTTDNCDVTSRYV